MLPKDNKLLLESLSDLEEKFGVSSYDLSNLLQKQQYDATMKKIRNTVDGYKRLLGMCYKREVEPDNGMFPKMYRFYKVVGVRSSNEYRVECLMFDEHPFYWFKYKDNRVLEAGNYYLGHFDFQSFWTDSVMVSKLEECQQITLDEYNQSARKYLEELLKMNWVADHHRYGGVLPGNKRWKDKDIT